jgi:hypothetical protein
MSEEIKEGTQIQTPPAPKKMVIDYKKASNSLIDQHILYLEQNNDAMDDLLNKEKSLFNRDLEVLFAILRSKNYQDFMELQGRALSLRQIIQDKIGFYMNQLSKHNAKLKVAIGERIEYYATGYGIKVSDGTRTKLIDRDLSERERTVEILQSHIEYLRECRNGCDQIGYAIKNLTALMTYISLDK